MTWMKIRAITTYLCYIDLAVRIAEEHNGPYDAASVLFILYYCHVIHPLPSSRFVGKIVSNNISTITVQGGLDIEYCNFQRKGSEAWSLIISPCAYLADIITIAYWGYWVHNPTWAVHLLSFISFCSSIVFTLCTYGLWLSFVVSCPLNHVQLVYQRCLNCELVWSACSRACITVAKAQSWMPSCPKQVVCHRNWAA